MPSPQVQNPVDENYLLYEVVALTIIKEVSLEGLVKAGAFDELETNRSSLLNSIPRLIQMNKSIFDEKDSNQNNLFSENSNEKTAIFNLEKTQQWSNNELLMNEFHSIGFYMSDHPLKIYKDYFNKSKVVSFKDFVNGSENSALVAGTIMSIQEKKSAKGTSFAIVKFSDLKSEFELFLFSDLLITNRDKLKIANSFILTLQKDNSSNSAGTRRINIKNINNLSNFTDKAFERVTIEINGKSDLDELRKVLKENGITKIQIKVCKKSKIYTFSLKNTRKFSLSTFNHIKNKEYVKKISF